MATLRLGKPAKKVSTGAYVPVVFLGGWLGLELLKEIHPKDLGFHRSQTKQRLKNQRQTCFLDLESSSGPKPETIRN